MSATISIVDPSDEERRVLAECMASEAAGTSTYASAEALLRALAADASGCVIVPSDLPEPGTRVLIEALGAHHPRLGVVVLGRNCDLATAVAFVRAGAVDYLAPPLSHRRLLSVVRWTLAPSRNSSPAARPG
jgi:two-component system nitrogen regulation response regulator GlnG